MLASINDNTSGDISAADVRAVIQALHDWIPATERYKQGRLAGETAHASDDFFSAYSGYTEATPSGTPNWAVSRGGLSSRFVNVASANIAATLKAIPAAGMPTTIETCVSMTIDGTNNPAVGLLFTNGTGTTATFAGFGIMTASGGGVGWSTPSGTLNSATSGLNAIVGTWTMGSSMFIRLIWSASNTFEVAVSPDGQQWVDFTLTTLARTFTPTHMGFYVTNWNSSTSMQAVTFNYLRVYDADLSV